MNPNLISYVSTAAMIVGVLGNVVSEYTGKIVSDEKMKEEVEKAVKEALENK